MDTSYHQQLLEYTGKCIRFYRKLNKLSQEELAAAIHKSESTLSKYERGAIAIDIATLYDIARVLKVSVSELMDFAPKPIEEKKAEYASLFNRSETLYIYYYSGKKKQFEYGIICLDYSRASGPSVPCKGYLDIPISGNLEDCTYYCIGTMDCYDMVTYINMQNTTMAMDNMHLYIMNPYMRNARVWGVFTGIAYDISSLFLYKTLIAPGPVAIGSLKPEDFILNSEDIKALKSRQRMEFPQLG